MHIRSFVTMSDGLDSLTAANSIELPTRSTTKTRLLINLRPLLYQLALVTSILHRLKSNQAWGHISPSILISPHSTYKILILYTLCQYITIILPLLYHNLLFIVYLSIVSTLVLVIKYPTPALAGNT